MRAVRSDQGLYTVEANNSNSSSKLIALERFTLLKSLYVLIAWISGSQPWLLIRITEGDSETYGHPGSIPRIPSSFVSKWILCISVCVYVCVCVIYIFKLYIINFLFLVFTNLSK